MNVEYVKCCLVNVWTAIEALGTIFAACVSLYLALRRPKERISGEWSLYPMGTDVSKTIKIRLKNKGRRNVDLPDNLRIDLYFGGTHWGCLESEPRQNNFIPAKFYAYETIVQLPDSILQHVIQEQDIRVFTWTKAGTRVELKRAIIFMGAPMPIIKQGGK